MISLLDIFFQGDFTSRYFFSYLHCCSIFFSTVTIMLDIFFYRDNTSRYFFPRSSNKKKKLFCSSNRYI